MTQNNASVALQSSSTSLDASVASPTSAPANVTAAPSPQSTNVPFNLIITTTRAQAEKIAKHFDLSTLRFVDSLHLPPGGAKRGDSLNELLGRLEQTVTLVLLCDDVWLNALLTDMPGMAAMVWRGIESKLMGHRTNGQRNLLIVAGDFDAGVRQAENALKLQVFTSGTPLHHSWKPPVSRPVPPKKLVSRDKAPRVQQVVKPETKAVPEMSPERAWHTPIDKTVGLGESPKSFGSKSPKQLDRSKKDKGPRPAGNPHGLQNDLYLLSKGHYGLATGHLFLEKAREIIAHHTGMGGVIPMELVCTHLFRTLIAKSSRGYWGGFNLLQNLVDAGGQSPQEVAGSLNGWIGNIPARDAAGKDILQPNVNRALYVKLNLVVEVIEAPAGNRELSEQAV